MSDKVHPPTPRRRQRAREEGRGPRSRDVVSAGTLLGATLVATWSGPKLFSGLLVRITEGLHRPRLAIDTSTSFQLIAQAIVALLTLVAPLLIATMMTSLALNLMQTSGRMVPNRLVPTADRLSPAKRLGESISIKSLGRFTIMVLKMLAILSVALIIFRNSLPEILRLVELQPAEIASRLFELSCRICLWTGSTLLVFSGLDYALAWWQHERDLMMTEQELRDELRDAEGAKQPVKTARSEAVRGVT